MARSVFQQPEQTNEQLFDSLVTNAIDFLESSIDDLNKRPKNSIVDFYTAIELFLKARLMLEHWTLILDEPGKANKQNFSKGDFKSVYFEDSVRRLKTILNIKLEDNILGNFKELGKHRNQIVHFAHAQYSSAQANKAGVVAQQWYSWHHLYNLLTVEWKSEFIKYQADFERVHRRMLQEKEFLINRFNELTDNIKILRLRSIKIVKCRQCGLEAGKVNDSHKWGDDYECLVCESNGVAVLPVKDTLPCPKCKHPFEFFSPKITSCTNCSHEISTNTLIRLCREAYITGDDWWEEGGECNAGCHVCQHSPNSVFFIDGQWSCVSCFDRGWSAISCPHCDEYVTGDMDTINYFACYKCEEEQRKHILAEANLNENGF
ncbi:hypothetical protein [Ewingella americana]|uniref:hypothetical protein n=1 Tax=Ewingella americana TaxID=41202 RepID=UPI0012AD92FE|nr:hypothetical protein [Ewingella americana]MRT05955.1 hypothetical protein [Ewingella americana]